MFIDDKCWYALYTKPRCEKKVASLLTQRGLEPYCPMNRLRKRYSDRIKWVEEPLFKSYVFVRIGEGEMGKVRSVNGVVNFVYWLGKPAVVRNGEIEIIRKFLDEHTEVSAFPVDVYTGSKVTIRKGLLMDRKARVLKVFHNKVRVVVESLNYVLVAVLDKANVSINND